MIIMQGEGRMKNVANSIIINAPSHLENFPTLQSSVFTDGLKAIVILVTLWLP